MIGREAGNSHLRRATNPEILGFLPRGYRWLAEAYEQLTRGKVPVLDAVLADGVLEITLDLPQRGRTVLQVRAHEDDARGFYSSENLDFSYSGTDELHPSERELLQSCVATLVDREDEMPPELQGFAAIVRSTGTPERDLLRVFRFLDVERSTTPEGEIVEVLIRTTGLCNQDCPFCSAPPHDTPSSYALRASFRAAGRLLPGATLILTGGEPGTRPRLVDEIRLALSTPGVDRVQLQTNAVPFARKHDPSLLPSDAPLSFFVSLHALDEDLYDACTGTKGQLPLALEGLNRILAAGHEVTLNTVINRINIDHLVDLMRGLNNALERRERLELHFSVLMCPEGSPDAQDLLVPYTELVGTLEAVKRQAEEEGLRVQSMLSSTHAALPACVLPHPTERRGRHRARILEDETGLLDEGRPWVRASSCQRCAEQPHCLGVPRPYGERFGLDELRPLGEG